MRPRRFWAVYGVVAAAIVGCGGGKQALTAGEVHQALGELPYSVNLKPTQRGGNGEGQVISGTARATDGTALDFAIAVEGADMPRAIGRRLGIAGAASFDTGWKEAYGIEPGSTPADYARAVRHPPSPTVRARQLERRRDTMSTRIEDAMCRYVECNFFPN